MSTVPETLMAKQMGCTVLGLSFITNLAFVKHDHKQVIAAAEASSAKMAELIQKLV
jgi:purine nucleoside phosphorylase